ncbi:MAG: hypothetical protein HY290_09840 [Planctomycetia bacterium]|nr:hypothetical protein [Planctomycetia bacterium]
MNDAISRWWDEFRRQAPRVARLFSREDEWDLAGWMNEHLGAIHPELMWEFGPAVRCEGHRLVITPETRRALRPLVREVLKAAPAMSGWEFYEYRLPENLELATQTVGGRVGGDFAGRRILVHARPAEFNRINLTFEFSPPDPDEQHAFAVAYVYSESLLGEEVLDRWIGTIDAGPIPDDGLAAIGLDELRAQVTELVREILVKLPDRPWHQVDIENGVPWAGMKTDPEEADDYPLQRDLFVVSTPAPEMLHNALSGLPFDSARFSRCGERFCFLKIDGGQGLPVDSPFADRSDIEDAINAVLRPAKSGCAIGGGTGLRYSYIELALTDVDAAWLQIQPILQAGGLSRRTWLMFHDDDLSRTWRGLFEDTPAPPEQAELPDAN